MVLYFHSHDVLHIFKTYLRVLNIRLITMKFNIYQSHRLLTHEDAKFAHAHKVLGVFCLFHFGYRIYNGIQYGDLGFDTNYTTLFTLLMHVLLHATSFQFILPNRKNKVYNIIWPEARWHSMIFAYRSLFAMLIIYLQESGILYNNLIAFACRSVLVYLTMVLADFVTFKYKMIDTTTMRDNPYPENTPKWLVFSLNTFYSISQVFATFSILVYNKNAIFLTLIPIQTAPFGMTLVKKGIIDQTGWHISYINALLISYIYGIYTYHSYEHFISHLVVFFVFGRFVLRMNKYILWTMMITYLCYSNHVHK